MNQNEKYMFYKNQMEKKLNAIKQGFFGYHTPVSKYVCDGKGVISDQKTEALADRLIHNILDVRAHSDYVMYGAAQRCLRLYIYLFVRAYGDGKKTFGDLLRMAAELRRYYGSLDDLILWETGWEPLDQYMEKMEKEIRESGEGDWETAKDWYLSAWERRVESGRRASGFWDDLNRSYELLAGHRISQEITEEELQQIWERQQSVIRQENECRQELWEQHAELDVDLYEQYMDELTYEQRVREAKKQELQDAAEYVGAEPEEESLAEAQPSSSPAGAELKSRSIFLTREEAEIRAAEEKKRQEAWKKKFKDPDKFLKAYGEFRRLFFCFGMDCEALEDAVICLLCEEGESGLMDEDRFWKMDVQIEHAYRLCRKIMPNGDKVKVTGKAGGSGVKAEVFHALKEKYFLESVSEDEEKDARREKERKSVPNEDRFKTEIFSALRGDIEVAERNGREPFLYKFLRVEKEKEAGLRLRIDEKQIADAQDGDELIRARKELLLDMLDTVRENPRKYDARCRERHRLFGLLGLAESDSLEDALRQAAEPANCEQWWQAAEGDGALESSRKKLSEAGQLFINMCGKKPDEAYSTLIAAYLDWQSHEKTSEGLLETAREIYKAKDKKYRVQGETKEILKDGKTPDSPEKTVEDLAAAILRDEAERFLYDVEKRSKNRALNLVSSYCAYRGISASGRPVYNLKDIDSEAFEKDAMEIYVSLKKNPEKAGDICLPLVIDAETGAGIFIIGKKRLTEEAYGYKADEWRKESASFERKMRASCCHFCYMAVSDRVREDEGKLKLEFVCDVIICKTLEEAILTYKTEDHYAAYKDMNGEIPGGTAEKFRLYFDRGLEKEYVR